MVTVVTAVPRVDALVLCVEVEDLVVDAEEVTGNNTPPEFDKVVIGTVALLFRYVTTTEVLIVVAFDDRIDAVNTCEAVVIPEFSPLFEAVDVTLVSAE